MFFVSRNNGDIENELDDRLPMMWPLLACRSTMRKPLPGCVRTALSPVFEKTATKPKCWA